MQKRVTKTTLLEDSLLKGALICSLYTLLFLSTFSFPTQVSSQILSPEETHRENNILSLEQVQGEQTWTDNFQQQIEAWIREISSEDEQFNTWQGARYEIHPFGPGSRQWIILLFQKEEEVGYLIVGQTSDQLEFELIEYGQTDEAIFSQALSNQPTFSSEDFLYHGLLWAKKEKNNMLIDMLSGDYYNHLTAEIEPYWLGETTTRLYKQVRTQLDPNLEPIVAYGQWTEEKGLSAYDLEEMNNYYYQGTVLPEVKGLYKVAAVHYWQKPEQREPILFVGLVDEGVRYLSYNYLHQLGSFAPFN